MALLCALPMLLLPVTVARVFGRARAGMAMLALPVLMWLANGTVLTGTEYGLADRVSPTRVYALYGLPASLMFLSLVLVAYAVTRRPRVRSAVAWTVVLVLLAACGNLLRSLSGVGIALAVAVVWWAAWKGRLRWLVAGAAAAASVVVASWLPGVAMDRINESRDRVVLAEASRLPDAHGTWHPLYLGLSYPSPITGDPSPFGVEWSDEWGWQKAREIDPDVVVASAEYDAIMKDLYLDAVTESPARRRPPLPDEGVLRRQALRRDARRDPARRRDGGRAWTAPDAAATVVGSHRADPAAGLCRRPSWSCRCSTTSASSPPASASCSRSPSAGWCGRSRRCPRPYGSTSAPSPARAAARSSRRVPLGSRSLCPRATARRCSPSR